MITVTIEGEQYEVSEHLHNKIMLLIEGERFGE